MIESQNILAKRYAQAFFTVFGAQFNKKDYENICQASSFFASHKQMLFFLNWPVIKSEIKIKTIMQALANFHLNKPFDKLIHLLAEHKRIFLIQLILEKLCELYKQHNNIMAFTISSSHELEKQQLEVLKQFLAKSTQHDIIYSYRVDKNLIAGIRMESQTLLWEYSVSKQLNSMKLHSMQ